MNMKMMKKQEKCSGFYSENLFTSAKAKRNMKNLKGICTKQTNVGLSWEKKKALAIYQNLEYTKK